MWVMYKRAMAGKSWDTHMDIEPKGTTGDTDRQRTDELETVSARYRTVVETSPLPIVMLAPDGTVLEWNPAAERLLGWTRDEALGNMLPTVTADKQVEFQELHARALAGETVVAAEVVRQRKDGHPIALSVSWAPIHGNDRSVVGVVAIYADISERMELERIKSRLLSIASHELRTPLTSVITPLELLVSGRAGPLTPDAQELASIAYENAHRLMRLLNDLLDLEKLRTGHIPIEKQHCRADQLVSQAARGLELVAATHQVNLEVRSQPVPLWVDPNRIEQVVINLLGNAIKFSPDGGTVTITVNPQSGEALFAVADQGRGIPPDKLDEIFGPFAQVERSDSTVLGGSGLGLAISRSIVERHGGRIWVESTVGIGSTFFFTLPLHG
jgi:PAS domain S-box-containing protein